MKKHLLSQLHKMKEIEPDKEWKSQSQEFLRTHLSGDIKSGVFSKLVIWIKGFAQASSQPAFALAAFVLILITGTVFFNPVLSDAKPNDSLYIARIISEKAQVNMTFNKESRERLSAQFATNHAKDITNLMNDPEFQKEVNNEDKIADLNENFNKEINSVRDSINNINENLKQDSGKENNEKEDSATDNNTNNLDENNLDSNLDEEGTVFSAETRKDEQGLEINTNDEDENNDINNDINNEDQIDVDENASSTTETKDTEKDETTTNASSTEEFTDENIESPEENLEENVDIETDSSQEENASSTLNELQSISEEVDKEGGDVDETNKVLDDAQRLFNEKKYHEALDKLDEVEKILEGVSAEISDEPSQVE
jgi:hypothetical protein